MRSCASWIHGHCNILSFPFHRSEYSFMIGFPPNSVLPYPVPAFDYPRNTRWDTYSKITKFSPHLISAFIHFLGSRCCSSYCFVSNANDFSSSVKFIEQYTTTSKAIIWLSPWNRIHLEKLIVTQVVYKLSSSNRTRRFITVFTTARRWSCPKPDASSTRLFP
jgi:hypothetical protein